MITPTWKAVGLVSLLRTVHSFQHTKKTYADISRRRSSSLGIISENDVDLMYLALNHAKKGLGLTFPNPAVGCVLVKQDSNEIIGAGYHPRAGFVHAEVFALWEACGHLPDECSGVQAAESVVLGHKRKRPQDSAVVDSALLESVKQLTEQYASEHGPQELFENHNFDGHPVTAYVTLEPCCHYGKTPPCAASLARAKVSRVVVGFGDPNPRVDGGGVKLLEEAGIQVDMMSNSEDAAAAQAHQACAQIVTDFVKRITPKSQTDFSYITGGMRRALRSHAGRMKTEKTLREVEWTGESVAPGGSDGGEIDWESLMQNLSLDAAWLERADHLLWEHEIVLFRLTRAAKKKKAVKLLGEIIANQLQAHVAQTVGHTVLVYRPGVPPVLDLATLGGKEEETST